MDVTAATPQTPRPATNTRLIGDLAIGIAGTIHVGMALFGNLYSPLFGAVLILLAGYRLLAPRCSRRGGRGTRNHAPPSVEFQPELPAVRR